MRVLLVEDDPDVATTISILFEIKFHKATMFATHSGEKALELIQNHVFDLIILDLGLADMSGLDVLREIRRTSKIPVIIVTANQEEETRAEGFRLGANDFITKPFGHLDFVERVRAQLQANVPPKPAVPLRNTI